MAEIAGSRDFHRGLEWDDLGLVKRSIEGDLLKLLFEGIHLLDLRVEG